MKEGDKREFDSIRDLSDQWWRDWDHKSRAEWKFSFGIWAGLIALSVAIAKAELKIPYAYIVVFAISPSVFLLHLAFLRWIQKMLTRNRDEMRRCQELMYKLTTLPSTLAKTDLAMDSGEHHHSFIIRSGFG